MLLPFYIRESLETMQCFKIHNQTIFMLPTCKILSILNKIFMDKNKKRYVYLIWRNPKFMFNKL